jgi:N utilization substance protein B
MTSHAPAARSRARRFVLQALYQMQLSGCSAADVETQFLQDFEMKRVDTDYLHDLLVGIEANRQELTEIFSAKLDRTSDELDPIERAVLWIGTFELAHRIDVPFKVSIDESVELAKQFGAAESHRLVNSVLDVLAKELRTVERQSLQER